VAECPVLEVGDVVRVDASGIQCSRCYRTFAVGALARWNGIAPVCPADDAECAELRRLEPYTHTSSADNVAAARRGTHYKKRDNVVPPQRRASR
jgi:hypothetical protein